MKQIYRKCKESSWESDCCGSPTFGLVDEHGVSEAGKLEWWVTQACRKCKESNLWCLLGVRCCRCLAWLMTRHVAARQQPGVEWHRNTGRARKGPWIVLGGDDLDDAWGSLASGLDDDQPTLVLCQKSGWCGSIRTGKIRSGDSGSQISWSSLTSGP